MKIKHYVKKGVKEGTKISLYLTKCHEEVAYKMIEKKMELVTCPNCLLQLMSDYENRIATLEDRYLELYPNRPVGGHLQ